MRLALRASVCGGNGIEQIPGQHAETSCEPQNRRQPGFACAAFHAADSGRVDVCRMCERVLRHPTFVAKLTEASTKCRGCGLRVVLDRGHTSMLARPCASVQSGLVGSGLVL